LIIALQRTKYCIDLMCNKSRFLCFGGNVTIDLFLYHLY